MATAVTSMDAQKALADVRRELQLLDNQYQDVGHELGDALARARTGDKKAEGHASKAAMRRAEITTERDRLQLEERALIAQVETLEVAEAAQEAAEAVARLREVSEAAHEVEARFARHMAAAADAAAELQAMNEEWNRAYKRAAAEGVDGREYRRPANPSRLFNVATITDPAGAVARWRRQYIDPTTPIPPRPLGPFATEQKRSAEMIKDARQREREQRAKDAGPVRMIVGPDDSYYGGAA